MKNTPNIFAIFILAIVLLISRACGGPAPSMPEVTPTAAAVEPTAPQPTVALVPMEVEEYHLFEEDGVAKIRLYSESDYSTWIDIVPLEVDANGTIEVVNTGVKGNYLIPVGLYEDGPEDGLIPFSGPMPMKIRLSGYIDLGDQVTTRIIDQGFWLAVQPPAGKTSFMPKWVDSADLMTPSQRQIRAINSAPAEGYLFYYDLPVELALYLFYECQ